MRRPRSPQRPSRPSDVIFVMDCRSYSRCTSGFPGARDRTFLLTSLASGTPLEIADHVDGDESRFQVCSDHISTAIGPIVHTLREAPVPLKTP